MCGIFGYVIHNRRRTRKELVDVIVNGLRRMEYRGYDSAGVAIDGTSATDACTVFKQIGKVQAIADAIDKSTELNWGEEVETHCGLGHTRWATHGKPSDINSHPHRSDEANHFVLVHNGIITNFNTLKTFLTNKGYVFESQTDTEVVAKLFLFKYREMVAAGKNPTFVELTAEVMSLIQGAYAFIVKSSYFPNELVAFKIGSPVVVGIKTEADSPGVSAEYFRTPRGAQASMNAFNLNNPPLHPMAGQVRLDGDMEVYIASDAAAIVEHTKTVLYLSDRDLIHVAPGFYALHAVCVVERKDAVEGTSNTTTAAVEAKISTLDLELAQIEKGGFDHFMAKEIFEQPESVMNTMRGRINFEEHTVQLAGIKQRLDDFKRARRIILIGCGTSFHSGLAGQSVLEELAEVAVCVENGSDFLDRNAPVFRDDVCVFISQSGETADVIKTLEYCKAKGALCVGVTNTVGSTIARSTDCGVHVNAGAEIGVASTKAYTSQVVVLIMLALQLSSDSLSKRERRNRIIDDLARLPAVLHTVLGSAPRIEEYCRTVAQARSMLITGRGYQHATCREGALKIKEITYMHAEGILSGELKHGTLALVDEHMPVIAIATKDRLFHHVESALQQVAAREGNVMVLCTEGSDLVNRYPQTITIPEMEDCVQAIPNIVPFQLMSYYIAVIKGLNVDQPRHLAKSVTVL